MGLILGVKAGEKIFIDDDWIRVVKVTGPHTFALENEDGSGYTINGVDDQPQEVLPEVFVSAGKIRSELPGRIARVFIEAPREMQILRQAPYKTLCLYEDAAMAIEALVNADGEPSEAMKKEALDIVCELREEIRNLTRGG